MAKIFYTERDIEDLHFMADGAPATLVSLHDISDRKAMELRLRQSEAYYRDLVEMLPEGITLIDLTGRITYLSPRTYEIFGIPHDSNPIGEFVLHWIHPDDRTRAVDRLQQYAWTGQPLPSEEYRLVKSDGSIIWAQLSNTPIFGEDGRPTGLIAAVVLGHQRNQVNRDDPLAH